jgi:hypothetical protein
MPKKIVSYSLFVASPSDISEERKLVDDVVIHINLTSGLAHNFRIEILKWETHSYPARAEYPQAVINNQIGDEYDIFVGILWSRFGTPTLDFESGTEEEFFRAFERSLKTQFPILMLYFKDAPIAPSKVDIAQLGKVNDFKEKISKKGILFSSFKSEEEFEKLFLMHITNHILKMHMNQIEIKRDPVVGNSDVVTEVAEALDEKSGFFDSLLEANDSFEQVSKILDDLVGELELLTVRLNNHTASINSVTGRFDQNRAMRIIDETSRDMISYSDNVCEKVPKFSGTFEKGLGSLIQALSVAEDFETSSNDTVSNNMVSLRELKKNIEDSNIQIANFRIIVQGLPRISRALNLAKQKVIHALSVQEKAFQTAAVLTEEAEKQLLGMMR